MNKTKLRLTSKGGMFIIFWLLISMIYITILVIKGRELMTILIASTIFTMFPIILLDIIKNDRKF